MINFMCRQVGVVPVTLLQSKHTSRKQAPRPLPDADGIFVLLADCGEANIVSLLSGGADHAEHNVFSR